MPIKHTPLVMFTDRADIHQSLAASRAESPLLFGREHKIYRMSKIVICMHSFAPLVRMN